MYRLNVTPSLQVGSPMIWHLNLCKLEVTVEYPGSSGETMTCRPWLVLTTKGSTWVICEVWVTTEPPSAETIENELLKVMHDRCRSDDNMPNVPAMVCVDTGVALTSLKLSQAGIQILNTLPGRPRGRGKIERVFAQLNWDLKNCTSMSMDELRVLIEDFIAQHNAKI